MNQSLLQGLWGGSVIKNLSAKQETLVQSLGQEITLKKEMATHFSIAQESPWTEEPAVRGITRVRHDLATKPPTAKDFWLLLVESGTQKPRTRCQVGSLLPMWHYFCPVSRQEMCVCTLSIISIYLDNQLHQPKTILEICTPQPPSLPAQDVV